MPLDVSTLALGGAVVAFNTAVTGLTNWVSNKAIKKLEQEQRQGHCDCRGCPAFDSCKRK